eukprot:snap_masked-scaffold_1-processed-gene-7.6-mRNA-1 protein AED:0.11 eAED:0.11 QI:0/-1/0/1/-1/1/1/0/273
MSCTKLSENYMKLLNLFVGLSGVVIIGYSAYLNKELEDYGSILEEFLLYGPLIFGCALVVLAGMGYYGAEKNNKVILLVYMVFTLIATLVVFGTGIALLVYSGVLDDVENAQTQEVSSGVAERINDFELEIFNHCCAAEFGLDEVPLCEDDENAEVCIVDEDRFDTTIENVGDEICEALAEVEINGSPVVGDPQDGGCGGGDAGVFVSRITQYLINNVKPLGSINLALGILLLLDLIATCTLLWKGKNEKKEEEAKEEETKEGQTGPEVAGGF